MLAEPAFSCHLQQPISNLQFSADAVWMPLNMDLPPNNIACLIPAKFRWNFSFKKKMIANEQVPKIKKWKLSLAQSIKIEFYFHSYKLDNYQEFSFIIAKSSLSEEYALIQHKNQEQEKFLFHTLFTGPMHIYWVFSSS